MNLFDLTGKVAVVTGASSGLGARAARAYAEHGAEVALLARRVEKIESVAAEITKDTGKKAVAIQCDVSNEENVKTAIDKVIAEFGKIDILLNNAGVAQAGNVETLTVEQWDNSMNINVKGIYLVSKYVVPHMRKQNYGKIVNTASVNAIIAEKNPDTSRHVYNASKAAVRGLTMGMAASYAQFNITVNSVGPGLFETEMTENTLFNKEGPYAGFLDKYNFVNPTGRPARKDELNGTIIYLSSDASSYVTSQHIIVDGGLTVV